MLQPRTSSSCHGNGGRDGSLGHNCGLGLGLRFGGRLWQGGAHADELHDTSDRNSRGHPLSPPGARPGVLSYQGSALCLELYLYLFCLYVFCSMYF